MYMQRCIHTFLITRQTVRSLHVLLIKTLSVREQLTGSSISCKCYIFHDVDVSETHLQPRVLRLVPRLRVLKHS